MDDSTNPSDNSDMEEDNIEIIYLDEDNEDLEDRTGDMEEPLEEENIEDISKQTFTKHTKSVFCSDLSLNNQLAITGGEDDFAYLWSTENGETILQCTGHKDSVTAVSFNHDNELVATGDMAGLIQVWKISEKKLVWSFEVDDMEWLAWHPLTNVLTAGTRAGEIYIWQVIQGNYKVLVSHGSACTAGKILSDGKHMLAGYEDGQVKLWDIKTKEVIWNCSQNTGITSLELNKDNTLISVAPTSNLLKLSDGKIISTLLVNGESEIEAHLFVSEFNILITGSLSGLVSIWDVSKQVLRSQANLQYSVTSLKLGCNGCFFTGTTSGVVYVCDIKTGNVVQALTGHKDDILSLSVSSSGDFVLATSDDCTAKIFDVKSS